MGILSVRAQAVGEREKSLPRLWTLVVLPYRHISSKVNKKKVDD
jgi:hypothetical protein